MNRFSGIGRLTKDPETRSFDNGNKTAFTIAIDRRFTNKDGNKEADFLPCVAWKGTADFIAKYFHKGMKIAVSGSVQVRSYTARTGAKERLRKSLWMRPNSWNARKAARATPRPRRMTRTSRYRATIRMISLLIDGLRYPEQKARR